LSGKIRTCNPRFCNWIQWRPEHMALRLAVTTFDIVAEWLYKKFVDICLTDFCYPRFRARS